MIIFVVLFLFLLSSVFNFQGGVQQEELETSFRQEAQRDLQRLSNCLRVYDDANTNSQQINLSKLEEFERNYTHQEPPCAEDFQFGYEARVQERFITGNQDVYPKADLVFLVDTSELILENELSELCEAQDEIVSNLRDRGYNVDFTVYGLKADGQCIETVLDREEEEEHAPVDHWEDWGPGITWAAENHVWRPNAQRFIFPMTDECPEDGGPIKKFRHTGEPVWEDCDSADQAATDQAIQAANENDVQVFTILADTSNDPRLGSHWDDHMPYVRQIASATDGDYFFAHRTGSIAEEISDIVVKNTYIYHNEESTCVLPTKERYGRSLDAALWVDASRGMEEEWESICDSVDDIEEELSRRGWVSDGITVYAPGNPGADVGLGTPVEIPEGGTYDHNSNLPSCVDATVDWDSSTTGFQDNQDYSLSAWGVGAAAVLNEHGWDTSAKRRSLVVISNNNPTGGEYRSADVSVAEDVISRAQSNNVRVSVIKDRTKNLDSDVQEQMDRVAEETDGESLEYSLARDLTDQIADGVEETAGDTCDNQEYVFGQTEGSEGRSLEKGLEMTFPVTIKRSGRYSTPATMFIRMRDGPMERIIGAANRITKRGRDRGEDVSAALWVNVEQELYGEQRDFEQPAETEYRLYNPNGGDISVDDGIDVGVNGRRVFSDLDEQPDSHTVEFTGYRGATFQVIAINQEHPSLGIDPMQIECISHSCDGPQTILDSGISQSEADSDYEGLGVFYYNFTTLDIGGTRIREDEAAICMRTSGDDNCGILRADSIEPFTLSSGRKLIQISYDYSTDTVSISG